MTLANFPNALGLSFPVRRAPTMSSVRHTAINGQTSHTPIRNYPRYQWELSYAGDGFLKSAAFGDGNTDLETLRALYVYLTSQGLPFAYMDAEDYVAAAQNFGIGDGVTLAFPLFRTRGGYSEPIYVPLQPAALGAVADPANPGRNAWPPNNLIPNSLAPATSFGGLNAMTSAGGASDPNGGAFGAIFTETATNAQHFADVGFASGSFIAGVPLTFSAYLKKSGANQYAQLILEAQSPNFSQTIANVDLVNGVITATYSLGTPPNSSPSFAISNAGGGWWRVSISATLQGGGNTGGYLIVATSNSANPGGLPGFSGSTGNSVQMAFPQIEHSVSGGAPLAYRPTLATINIGQPQVFVGGSYVDPSTYSIGAQTGIVTFASAPAASALLTWTGWFSWLCRFDEDTIDFSRFMQGLSEGKSIKFSSELNL